MPRFSVIVPVYNRVDEVRDLMESLAAQTCGDFETVIVEDGRPSLVARWSRLMPERST